MDPDVSLTSPDGVVVPIRAHASAAASDQIRLAALDPRLTVHRDWPRRTALVVGTAPNPDVLAVLQQCGFSPFVVPPDRVDTLIHSLGPFSFLLLGPEALADDDAVDRVHSWHRCSPSARIKLVVRADAWDYGLFVRGARAGVVDIVDPDDREALDGLVATDLASAGAHRERVLAIGAHPDDVEIGCAGTLLDHRLRGDRITILTLSRGAVGGDTDNRVHEATATADAIGAQLLFADLPDTCIDGGVETIRLIESVVHAIDPTVVYVHSAHDNHQDHRAVSTATRSATRGVRRVFGYQSPSATNEFNPTQFVPIDDVVHAKVDVLQLFDSQSGRPYLEPELVVAGSRYWARHLGANARYAEPFEVIRSVGDLRQSATTPTVFPVVRSTCSVARPATTAYSPAVARSTVLEA